MMDELPPGVVSVLNGGGDIGAVLTLHPGVCKVSFTGTIPNGHKVYESFTRDSASSSAATTWSSSSTMSCSTESTPPGCSGP
jgi:acyl-CoA reductase-like NAD-dependent aldehyde dehydrogenase